LIRTPSRRRIFLSSLPYLNHYYPGVMAAVDVDGDGDIDLVWADGGTNYYIDPDTAAIFAAP